MGKNDLFDDVQRNNFEMPCIMFSNIIIEYYIKYISKYHVILQ